jgi:hypothetical protein
VVVLKAILYAAKFLRRALIIAWIVFVTIAALFVWDWILSGDVPRNAPVMLTLHEWMK